MKLLGILLLYFVHENFFHYQAPIRVMGSPITLIDFISFLLAILGSLIYGLMDQGVNRQFIPSC